MDRLDGKIRDMREALEELRKQTSETLRFLEEPVSIEDALHDVLDGELSRKVKLVKDTANAVNDELGRLWERSQNRADGYGSVDC